MSGSSGVVANRASQAHLKAAAIAQHGQVVARSPERSERPKAARNLPVVNAGSNV